MCTITLSPSRKRDQLKQDYFKVSATFSCRSTNTRQHIVVKQGSSLKDLERKIGSTCRYCGTQVTIKNNIATDHLGNLFFSIGEMCEHYGVPKSVYQMRRLSYGFSQEDALTKEVKPTRKGNIIFDGFGNMFPSAYALAKHYNLSASVVQVCLDDDRDLKDLILKNSGKRKDKSLKKLNKASVKTKRNTFIDHEGNEFLSLKAMLEYWDISYSLYYQRLNVIGWSIEETLTTPKKPSPKRARDKVFDHLGNIFATKKDMAQHYGIPPHVLQYRLKVGVPVEEALTLPVNKEKPYFLPKKHKHKHLRQKDHLGNEYLDMTEMAKHYNISPSTLRRRIDDMGMSLEEALTTPKGGVKKKKKGKV